MGVTFKSQSADPRRHRDGVRWQSGVTLLETVIYAGLVGVVVVVTMQTLLGTATVYGRARNLRNVNDQGVVAMERVLREIKLAHAVGTAGSVFDTNPGTLELSTAATYTDMTTTTRKFFLQSGSLVMQDNVASPVALTGGVTISNLVFRMIGRPAGAGVTYYVRGAYSSCSDSASGTSATSAFCTISKAAAVAGPGDVVYVGGGTYLDAVNPVRSGTSGALISYIADMSGVWTGDAGNVLIDGGNTRCYAFDISDGEEYLVIDGFRATNQKDCGGNDGAYFFYDGDRNIYRNLVVYDSGEDGIVLGGTGNLLKNCLVYDSDDEGIEVEGSGNTVQHCTFIRGGDPQVIDDNNHTNFYEHNIIDGGLDSTGFSTFQFNLWTGGLFGGTGNITGDPRFVNASGDDYHLSHIAAGQSVNSPAMNAGSSTAAAVGLSARSTRSDNVFDAGIADMGYHFGASAPSQSEAVRVEMTVESGAGKVRAVRRYYGTAVLRRSY